MLALFVIFLFLLLCLCAELALKLAHVKRWQDNNVDQCQLCNWQRLSLSLSFSVSASTSPSASLAEGKIANERSLANANLYATLVAKWQTEVFSLAASVHIMRCSQRCCCR